MSQGSMAMDLGGDRNEALDQLSINTIRTLSMDGVQQANSGHPGTPMALAPVTFMLWDRFLRYNPGNPGWANRDRFVLSAGHASMLLYSVLHLAGFDLPLEELKRFRQWSSLTPGHPEYGHTSGVETTTGPLGQGVATSVGMAIAERWLASRFNTPEHKVVDHRVYAICGDGDLMEGISHEAASYAGHLRLSNLVWIYDNNRITIEGSTDLTFSDDIAARFMSYHWNVMRVGDANDLRLIEHAVNSALRETSRPSLIIVDSHIAWGAPTKQGTSAAHGEPLGEEEIRRTKERYGWPPDAKFLVPDEVKAYFTNRSIERGRAAEAEWNRTLDSYRKASPELAAEWDQLQSGRLPEGWDSDIPSFPADPKGFAGRDASGKSLNAIAAKVPWLMGGSADLAPSTKTRLTSDGEFQAPSHNGRNMHFGVREHAMGAILNGMTLSGLRAFGSGFLIFSDYMRASVRLSALMQVPVIYIFTHDSIGVGEDGPTHQPIEQLISLRAIPQLLVMRPGDSNEVAEAWRVIMETTDRPVALILSRQALPTFDRDKYASARGVRKGGYVIADSGGDPEVILMSTGSELQLCMGAFEKLAAEGVRARVVSLPCWELFERQPEEYRDEVLPPSVRARVAVEAGSSLGWRRFVGLDGRVIARREFGASAPIKDLLREFGFTVENVVSEARTAMARVKSVFKN